MFKKITYLLCIGLMLFSLGGCDDEEIATTDPDTNIEESSDAKEDTSVKKI